MAGDVRGGDLRSGSTVCLRRATCHVPCAGINFDTGYDSRLGNGLNEGSAIFFLLTDGLVIEDYATNALTETGGSHYQLPIGAPGLLDPRNPQLCKSFIARRITLIHRQQALVASHQRHRGACNSFGIAPLPVPDFREILAVLIDVL